MSEAPPGFEALRGVGLTDALPGRRSRRVFRGAETADTPGPWKDTPRVRGAGQVHDERFRQCVAHQAQYIYDTFGKFPGTVPSIFPLMYLQAHHLDLDVYDRLFTPGAYLRTHAEHMRQWHPAAGGGGMGRTGSSRAQFC